MKGRTAGSYSRFKPATVSLRGTFESRGNSLRYLRAPDGRSLGVIPLVRSTLILQTLLALHDLGLKRGEEIFQAVILFRRGYAIEKPVGSNSSKAAL